MKEQNYTVLGVALYMHPKAGLSFAYICRSAVIVTSLPEILPKEEPGLCALRLFCRRHMTILFQKLFQVTLIFSFGLLADWCENDKNR